MFKNLITRSLFLGVRRGQAVRFQVLIQTSHPTIPGRMVNACDAARLMGSLPSTALSRRGGVRRSRWRSSWLPAVLKAAASACKQAAATLAWDSPVCALYNGKTSWQKYTLHEKMWQASP